MSREWFAMMVLVLGVARRVGWRRVGGSVFAGRLASTRVSFRSGLDVFLGIISKNPGFGASLYGLHITEGIVLSTDSGEGHFIDLITTMCDAMKLLAQDKRNWLILVENGSTGSLLSDNHVFPVKAQTTVRLKESKRCNPTQRHLLQKVS